MSLLQDHPVIAKLVGILTLAVLLTLPLRLITGLLSERTARRDTALAEITQTWGPAQQITGPFLIVPYRDSAAASAPDKLAVFLPETLLIDGQVDPVVRHRGIYQALVYEARLTLSGRFAPPDPATLGLSTSAAFRWDRAYLSLGVDDLRGAREALAVTWDGHPLPLETGARHELLPVGVHAPLPAFTPASAPVEFTLPLALNGSGRLAFTPVGRQSTVTLRSPWADPGFTGALSPQRTLAPEGFTATWQASYYGREYARQWTPDLGAPSRDQLARSSFGVELLDLVDSYRTIERATKYGLLFFTLLFAAFFLFEVVSALRLHVVHYLLVGAALVLFYLALLSISEFARFGAAYLVAAGASTLLISLYSLSILRGGARSLVITAALGGIYGFLYFVLRMQDYSLLAGTAALFVVLALVMYLTRKIDWHREAPEITPPPLPDQA